MLKKLLIHTKKSMKIFILIAFSIAIIAAIVIIFFQPTYSVIINGTTGWYIPAIYELNKIKAIKSTIATACENLGKENILQVYESKLFKEIFYLTEEFKDFLYPFEGEEKYNIFNEMFENTKFYPFEFDYLNGYTNKILPKILISSIIKDGSNLEKIIINFTHILNTMFHEQMKHYIKMLIHYNSLRLSLSVSLESDKYLKDDTFEKYLKIVKKKKKF